MAIDKKMHSNSIINKKSYNILNIIKRYTSLLLLTIVVISLVLLASSCAKLEYDEAEVKQVAEKLIKTSESLNEIYYGKGLGYTENLSDADGIYHEADPLSTNYYGISTVDDLKKMTRDTYSIKMSNSIIERMFSGVSDSSGKQGYNRYWQKTIDGEPVAIMVNTEADVFLKDKVTYDYSTITISDVGANSLFVTLSCVVENPEGKTQNTSVKIELLYEGGVFKINSPTYVRYTDDAYYNELQNKFENQK